MLNRRKNSCVRVKQRGAAAVEFGIIAILFFTLFFGIIEFGRYFYLANTVQEVTRCAAREAVVNYSNARDSIQRKCIFQENSTGTVELVAGWEIQNDYVQIRYLNAPNASTEATPNPDTPLGNLSECALNTSNCIRFVEASVQQCSTTGRNRTCSNVVYQPVFGLFPLSIAIPNSTITMPIESLGYAR